MGSKQETYFPSIFVHAAKSFKDMKHTPRSAMMITLVPSSWGHHLVSSTSISTMNISISATSPLNVQTSFMEDTKKEAAYRFFKVLESSGIPSNIQKMNTISGDREFKNTPKNHESNKFIAAFDK
eukprot:scaffold2169_cov53-Attheya_sp.AAC.4